MSTKKDKEITENTENVGSSENIDVEDVKSKEDQKKEDKEDQKELKKILKAKCVFLRRKKNTGSCQFVVNNVLHQTSEFALNEVFVLAEKDFNNPGNSALKDYVDVIASSENIVLLSK